MIMAAQQCVQSFFNIWQRNKTLWWMDKNFQVLMKKVHKRFIIRGASFIFFNVSCGAGSTSAPALSSLAPASSVSYHVAAWKHWFTVIFSLTGRCQPSHLLPHLSTYVGISPFKGKMCRVLLHELPGKKASVLHCCTRVLSNKDLTI